MASQVTGAAGQGRGMKSKRKSRTYPVTPAGVIKHVLRKSRSLGAISFTYHIAPAVRSPQINVPRLLFSNAWADKAAPESISMRRYIEKVHDQIIAAGVPTTYTELMKDEPVAHSDIASEIVQKVDARGIVDEYIIPVYGPYKIEGCMCFGFTKSIYALGNETRNALEVLATSSHVKIVSTFKEKINKIALSKRETQVLRWLALGKSQSDIATILGLKSSTIDSYTRRIYSKLGVNTKIAAVLAGISTGKIII